MIVDESNYLAHYGILRKSGRYPWGSGETQNQRNRSFLDHVEGLRREGLSETDIAKGLGMTTTQLRAVKSIAKNETRQADISMAQRLKDKGYSNVAIGERMNRPESSVRAMLADGAKDRADVLQVTSSMLKEKVDAGGFIDVGVGVNHNLGISETKLSTAVAMLKEQGYEVHPVQVDQAGTQQKTTYKVLCPPGTTYKDVVTNKDNIRQIAEHSEDGGRSYLGLQPPVSLSSKRVAIRYAEDGGAEADGVMYVRPGVDDVSLGGSRYAQVRVAVDGTHYLKGMAMYKEDLPAGVDVMFNTNKSSTGNKLDAMKPMKKTVEGDIDPDNPFGSMIKRQVLDDKGKVKSSMNLVNEEGNWDSWRNAISTQVLSKQSPLLAKTQLDMTYERAKNDLDEIMSLTNPTVRRKLLESYADGADSSAVHLKAASLPRQRSQVILPINTLKDNEIYAPNFRNGEKVALIRYPHGGVFEIPELVVNNNHGPAKTLLGRAQDAVGINHKVAERLSGADFDGDTVLVIPNNKGSIKTKPPLASLKDFDPQRSYPKYEGMKVMDARTKGFQMGDVSNLITDMTIMGANDNEIARAVRHSMVVIDAEKHELNWKQSAKDNGISQLKTKYQGKSNAGAATLISRATSRQDVRARTPRPAAKGGPVDRATGKRVYEETGESWVNAKGKTVFKTRRSVKLAETDDANSLSSGTPIEKVYADHSNRLKALANSARKSAVNTQNIPYSPSAKKVYANEARSLDAKLNIALRNAPRERQAQVLANTIIAAKTQAYPDMDPADLKKIKAQALTEARVRSGAKKTLVDITDAEWKAIQAGAISPNKLQKILTNTDLDRIKELATPRTKVLMTSAKTQRAQAMAASGYTQAEIADALGVSLTTLKTELGGGN